MALAWNHRFAFLIRKQSGELTPHVSLMPIILLNVPCLPRKKVVFGCQLCNSTLSFLAVKFVDGINFYVSPLIPAKLAGSYDVPKVFELFRDGIYL